MRCTSTSSMLGVWLFTRVRSGRLLYHIHSGSPCYHPRGMGAATRYSPDCTLCAVVVLCDGFRRPAASPQPTYFFCFYFFTCKAILRGAFALPNLTVILGSGRTCIDDNTYACHCQHFLLQNCMNKGNYMNTCYKSGPNSTRFDNCCRIDLAYILPNTAGRRIVDRDPFLGNFMTENV